MKKYISFFIIFIPWLLTIFIIPLNNKLNNLLIFYIIVSLLFYFFITLFLFRIIKKNIINKDIALSIILLYIFNQSFNLSIFYYKNFYITLMIALFMILSFKYFFKFTK